MATCKIMRRNFALKIGSSKEACSLKDRKSALNREMTSFLNKSMTARSSGDTLNPSPNLSFHRRKENSTNYWNDLSQPKVAPKRGENIGPLRAMRSALYNVKPATIVAATSSGKLNPSSGLNHRINHVFGRCNAPESTNEDTLSQRGAVATLAANRRILKSPNGFKIFPNRRFGSSASSSCCSLFRRHDDRRRVSDLNRTFRGGYADRAYNTQTSASSSNNAGGNPSISNISSPKYLVAMRNQNMSAPLGSVSQAVQVSSKIQQELMPVDKSLRERISLKNAYSAKPQHESKETDPMCGWNHPPSPDLLSTRLLDRLAERRTVSSISDKKQESRMRTVNRKRRLDMQCKPMPENPCPTVGSPTTTTAAATGVTAASINKKASVPQQSNPLTCESGVSSEVGVSSRHMSHLTARRLTNVDQQPIRRFSLRRPPKTSLTEITPPAPGPAAESLLIQQNGKSSTPRTMTAIAYNQNSSRYSRLNYRAF